MFFYVFLLLFGVGLCVNPESFGLGTVGGVDTGYPRPCTAENINLIYSHSEAKTVDTSTYAISQFATWKFSEECSFVVFMKYLKFLDDWIYWGTGALRTDKTLSTTIPGGYTETPDYFTTYTYFSGDTGSGNTLLYNNYNPMSKSRQINTSKKRCYIYSLDYGLAYGFDDGCGDVAENDCPTLWHVSYVYKMYFVVRGVTFFQFRSGNTGPGLLGFYTIPLTEYFPSPTRPFLCTIIWTKMRESTQLLANLKNQMMEKLVLGSVGFSGSECSNSDCTITQPYYQSFVYSLVDSTYQNMILG